MKRSAKLPLFHRIKTLFNRIFHPSKEPSHEDISCPDMGSASLIWDKPDAMVGTVRSWEQLSYNLSHRCYYVPGRFLTEENFPVQYIALHEKDSQQIPCIVRVGEVVSVVSIPRKAIPVAMRSVTDPNELYYFFTVKEWADLPHRIEIQDTPWGRPLFTHRFLLDRYKVSWELFAVSSQEEYSLLQTIHHLLRSKKSRTCPIGGNRTLTLKKRNLTIWDKDQKPLEQVPLKEYKSEPRSAFLRLKKALL